MTGTIKALLPKGFGFITTPQGDFFFHAQDLANRPFDELVQGERVTFEVGQSARGPRAHRVTVQ